MKRERSTGLFISFISRGIFLCEGVYMSNNKDKLTVIQSLDDLLSKIDLYVDLEFNIYQLGEDDKLHLNQNELKKLENALGLFQSSIDSYCVFCEKNYPFTISFDSTSKRHVDFSSSDIIAIGNGIFINLDNPKNSWLPKLTDKESVSEFKVQYINYTFVCKKNEGHVYKMFLVVLIAEGLVTVRKIGQFPSKIDIWGFDFDQYRSQLNKINAYGDFKKAELCMSDGLYAGAYAYLRRVFEKMLKEYCKQMTLKDNHVETKIEACMDRFDERVKPLLKSLYSILSVSIHELDDEQSEQYYVYLRTVIEMQLEFVKEKNDRDNQTKQLKEKIDSIINDLK